MNFTNSTNPSAQNTVKTKLVFAKLNWIKGEKSGTNCVEALHI